MEETTLSFELPGFRFHPTEEELVDFYLKNMVYGKKMHFDVIGFLNIYHHDPQELPGLAKIDGDREWYFFVPRDRKHANGGRPNRITQRGFWKATGSDRKVVTISEPKRAIGLKKTLVFYEGRAPRGSKTDWVMNEYRLPDHHSLPMDIVLCKVYRKATPLKVLEKKASMEEEMNSINYGSYPASPLSFNCAASHCGQLEDFVLPMRTSHVALKEEETKVEEKFNEIVEESTVASATSSSCSSSRDGCIKLPFGKDCLPEIQVPKPNLDWAQDSFWSQLDSPWLENLTPYASILNF
ncbi:hypothetical protein Nepgr_015351 [Nepenthes gracilis]|uniref:NAC domain-containing protein n=1 Tax=Nepenthes gracilis TaxID=150966 RepID=A0AAD3SMR2_NEPGR|nr:hypothetical protein Nepgr_015351 [Nepenthes gracilis]